MLRTLARPLMRDVRFQREEDKMANNQQSSNSIRPVVCWHHGDLERLQQCLAKNYCDLYGLATGGSNWWRKLGLNVGHRVRFSVKGKVVASGKIQSEPYDLAARRKVRPVDPKWPGAVDIGDIRWRDEGSCSSPPALGSHRL